MKMDDSRGFAQVEVAELDSQTFDGRVLKVGFLGLDSLDFLGEVFETSIDGINVNVAHVVVWLVGSTQRGAES